MKLINCYIENFGKISKQRYDFKDGFNCIVGENGSGKTTLAAFIKAMLYGLGDTKKASLTENDRKHYMPWQGGVCGGHLTFSAGPKTYRIERSFSSKASEDTYTLYDTATGKVCYDYANPGEELFGIDADGFERTVFLSERVLAPSGNNPTVSARLANLVGCDGDIGEIDDTLKAMEEKRKIYYKKGGGGEIADTKTKIAEINRQLEALEETEAALENEYKRLGDISEQIKSARAESTALVKEREKAALRAAEADFEKRYKQMQQTLEQNVRRKEELTDFFGGRVPTFDEIDAASKKNAEAEILTKELSGNPSDSEYATLVSYFNGKIDKDDVKKINDALEVLNEQKKTESSAEYYQAKKMFAKRTPDISEIEKAEKNVKGLKETKSSALYAVIVLLAIVSSVLGIIVSPLLFGLLAVCALGFAILLFNDRRTLRGTKAEINDFFSSVAGRLYNEEDHLAVLSEMRRLLPLVSSDSDQRAKDAEAFLNEISIRLNGTLSKDPCAFAKEVTEKHEKLLALAMADKYMSTNKAAKAERASILSAEVNAFLHGFNTVSEDPFTEIRYALSEYMRLSADIVAKREEIASYQSRHVIGEGEERMAALDVTQIDLKCAELDKKIAGLEREHALSDRASKNYSDKLEERHELLQKRIELEEKLADITEKYEIILQTKKYISLAADNMTARYIGKTVESFKKYNEAIMGEDSENFQMDTDFGISKIEGTGAKSIDAYSRGTKDLYNLSARLALVDSLYDKERPFIIFDDPFTALDDEKTKSALRLLKKFANDSQVIYFTCSKSRSS